MLGLLILACEHYRAMVEWLSSLTTALSKYSICVLVVAINTHELIRSINWLPAVVVQVLVVV